MALGSALSLLDLTVCSFYIFHIWAACGLAEALNARILWFCQTAMLHRGQKCWPFFPPDSDSSGNSLPEFNTVPTRRQKASVCLRCYFRGFLNTVGFNRLNVLSADCSFWPKAEGIIKCVTQRSLYWAGIWFWETTISASFQQVFQSFQKVRKAFLQGRQYEKSKWATHFQTNWAVVMCEGGQKVTGVLAVHPTLILLQLYN